MKCSGSNVKVLGLIETKESDGQTERSKGDIEKDIEAYTTHNTDVKGFYFNNAHGSSQAVIDGLMSIAHDKIPASMFTVFGLGIPLLEKSALQKDGAPDVWVTLNTGKDAAGTRLGGDLGSWTPFSWYPYEAATLWSAMVTEVKADNDDKTNADGVTSTLSMMLDRGYGYVYLHSDANYNTTSSHLADLITAIGAKSRRLEATGRRLQTLDNGVSTKRYECDDTLFQCEPVCLETVGVVRNKVSDSQCNGAEKPEACSCRCYHHTQWTCEDNKVVCKASLRDGGLETVGDRVCTTRGTPKPTWDANPERMATECTVLPTQRDDQPTEQCMEKYRREKMLVTALLPKVELVDFELMVGAVHVAVGAALLALA